MQVQNAVTVSCPIYCYNLISNIHITEELMESKKATVSKIMIFALNVCLLYLIGKPFISSIFYYAGLDKPWRDFIAEIIIIGLTVIMALITRKDNPSYGIQKGTYKGSLKYIIPLSLLALMLTPYFFLIPMEEPIVPAVFHIIYIGIMEELIFRGLIYRAAEVLTNEHKTIIISSILFGLFHLVNLSGDNAVAYVLLQVAFTAFIGLGFAALRAKTRSILAGVLIHIVLDVNALFVDKIDWWENVQIAMFFVVGILLYVFYRVDRSKTGKQNLNHS
jgi:membrane protease YdiL (CAAX protease family)